jgi:hypothetical protein
MSSYPEVQSPMIEAESDSSAAPRRYSRRHAIVSIYGKDVDEKILERKIA